MGKDKHQVDRDELPSLAGFLQDVDHLVRSRAGTAQELRSSHQCLDRLGIEGYEADGETRRGLPERLEAARGVLGDPAVVAARRRSLDAIEQELPVAELAADLLSHGDVQSIDQRDQARSLTASVRAIRGEIAALREPIVGPTLETLVDGITEENRHRAAWRNAPHPDERFVAAQVHLERLQDVARYLNQQATELYVDQLEGESASAAAEKLGSSADVVTAAIKDFRALVNEGVASVRVPPLSGENRTADERAALLWAQVAPLAKVSTQLKREVTDDRKAHHATRTEQARRIDGVIVNLEVALGGNPHTVVADTVSRALEQLDELDAAVRQVGADRVVDCLGQSMQVDGIRRVLRQLLPHRE